MFPCCCLLGWGFLGDLGKSCFSVSWTKERQNTQFYNIRSPPCFLHFFSGPSRCSLRTGGVLAVGGGSASAHSSQNSPRMGKTPSCEESQESLARVLWPSRHLSHHRAQDLVAPGELHPRSAQLRSTESRAVSSLLPSPLRWHQTGAAREARPCQARLTPAEQALDTALAGPRTV